MEIFLLVLLFVVLIYIKNGMDTRFNNVETKLYELYQVINQLKKDNQTLGKTPEIVPEKPKPEPAPPISKPAAEEIKPTAIPVATEEVHQPKPAPVYETAKPETSAPKPIYIAPEPKKSWWDNFKERNPDLEKFIGENLINKIGVLILVLGISYFVKYAIDKDWINEPARVGIGVLCGGLLLGFAHKLRKNYAAFSSVLVAGAIAIFYFTIAIAFHDYHLFGQTAAFIIMVAITAFSALISLSYDRKELAVLSLIGGFAVPFMVSTGEGNYVVLMSYLIILDVGILILAYHKKWGIINILSYVFTVILYGSWLGMEMFKVNPHYLGALVFGFAFYLIFILINIINNLRTKGTFSVVALYILASNTFLFYAAGMIILSAFHPEFKGLFTTVLALLNLIYAWFLYREFGLDKTAVYLLIGLTLTFVTLAIPIQFQGNYITLFWAGEAVLLLWLSQKSKIIGYRFGSIVVQILMLFSLIMDWLNIYNSDANLTIILNPAFITGLVTVASFAGIYWLLKPETENYTFKGIVLNPKIYAKICLLFAIITAYFTGILETAYQASSLLENPASAAALPVAFHLIFCGSLFYLLIKSKNILNIQIATIIGLANIILYAFWFSIFAFKEHKFDMSFGNISRSAFSLHYLSLGIVIFMFWQIIKINNQQVILNFLRSKFMVWIAAFFIIYFASQELMIHSMVASNSPVTTAELKADANYNFHNAHSINVLRGVIAENHIQNVKYQVIKTGFPILWGILAFIFLIVGIKIRNKNLRIIALALLGITILKLFLFDIRNVSETGKIIAFILLGILILIISFVYQKIRVLVTDDNKTESDEKI